MPAEAGVGVGERLRAFWQVFRPWLRTKTRDTSEYGYHYLSGLLRMDSERNISEIGRQCGIAPQNLQHFISESPWAGVAVITQVQRQIRDRAEVQSGAMLLLDDSASDRSGGVGTARQYNGRHGKIDESQVGVFVSLVKGDFWCWVDGELYIPQHWFEEAYGSRRQQVELPPERTFQTKVELGWQLIERVRANAVPFEAVACDTQYGRSAWLRQQLANADLEYYADVPINTRIYLDDPAKGLQPTRVDRLKAHPQTHWQYLELRVSERGFLSADFAFWRVWTLDEQGQSHQEWLILRRDRHGKCSYTLSNAPATTPLLTLAQRKSARYFIERANQDAKSEFGWEEFQATKFRAWQHHLALTILAAWFIAETKLDWALQFARDPELLVHYEIEGLPALSVANVRSLLRAALPLPQLSPEQATRLVIQHLQNRTRSRKSRLKRARNRSSPVI